MSPSAMPSPAGSPSPRQLLQVKAEDVGRAIVTPVVAVQDPDLVVVGEDQRRRRARAAERPQRDAHARGDAAANLRVDSAARAAANQGRDRHFAAATISAAAGGRHLRWRSAAWAS